MVRADASKFPINMGYATRFVNFGLYPHLPSVGPMKPVV